VLSEFLAAGTESASAVQRGVDAQRRLLDAGPLAVPDIEARLASGTWSDKVKCYSLLVEMGDPARESLERGLADKPSIVIIWDSAVLYELQRPTGATELRKLLRHADPYVRHLSALVLAFRHLPAPTEAEWLVPDLIDALRSDALIEGSAFSVAAGSLALLNLIAGRSFLRDGKPIEIYNYTWMFPPPVLPFPLSALTLDPACWGEIISSVQAWWTARLETKHTGSPAADC
jgi:HEAT repeat protein